MPLLPPAVEPFHDSGPLCVSANPAPLGSTVSVRLWLPDSWPVASIALRQVRDGEPVATTMTAANREGAGQWFEGAVEVHNPLTRYRFCLVGTDRSPVPYAWLTAAGVAAHDVSDSTDFSIVGHEPAPAWVDSAIVYQIFPDRFARSASSPIGPDGTPSVDLPDWAIPMPWDGAAAEMGHENGRQIFGGDLDGIIDRLDHIQSLGANTLYLTPIFPAGSAHRYDASAFDHVDPLLGGDEALIRLIRAVHERGMRIILDLTTNHTGDGHRWFQAARADREAPERAFYMFSEPVDATADPCTDDYVGWLGVPSLPKLDHGAAAMREALYEGPASITARYLSEPFGADGWRIDVANMTGRFGAQDLAHDVASTMRRTMSADHWLIAEHGHDATRDLDGDGWHGTMNYVGFTRPIWAWLADEDSSLNWLGLPMSIPRLSGTAIAHTLRRYNAEMPYPSQLHSQNLLSSHDTPRIRTVTGSVDRTYVAFGLLAALPGVPTVFAGDELAGEGRNGEHSRTPMPWEEIDSGAIPAHSAATLDWVRRVLRLRAEQPALNTGGLRWLHTSDDAIVFVRTHPSGSVLVHAARAGHDSISIDVGVLLGEANTSDTLLRQGELSASLTPSTLTLTSSGPGVQMLALTPSLTTVPE